MRNRLCQEDVQFLEKVQWLGTTLVMPRTEQKEDFYQT